ncbi:ferrous iron transport protein B [Methylococcus capsulatus]|uniref:ferrous iron transport protein B n=1 Tax=Methylococcus capsulatus TaxID=414 RepID=UPI001C532569|nr:ferrous iron transport protein B [Methylococcus capsulatus]QXP94820.1 ferrous iron transport protein B [Methylococcus capsulatus]
MKRIALVGMPNTGKSTFFNRLTGASARVGNWPGITVDLLSARIILGGTVAQVVDLPGIYSFHGFSEDEKVVRDFLENNPVDLVAVVLNATQIDRQLPFALQVARLGLPTVLLLNMADEARHLGISIDARRMAELLRMPVILLSAKYGNGFQSVTQTLLRALDSGTAHAPPDVAQTFSEDHQIETAAAAVMRAAVRVPRRLPENATTRIDRLLLHPWAGLPLFFLFMFLLFQFIFTLGKPMQDGVAWALTELRTLWLEPLTAGLPAFASGLLLDGIYNGVGTVAAFVPIIILFFLVMTLIEDSGYLSRVAFLMDALMARLGLDGRSFVMLLMGFGCNVPALMGTRVMRSRDLRLLTMLVIPFSLCSARLQVFLFITAALFTVETAPAVLFSLYLLSFTTALTTAVAFKNRFVSNEPFVIELPPYRLPTWRQIFLRGWHEVRHFLRRASKFITAGVVAVWLLTHLPTDVPAGGVDTLAGHIAAWLAPVLSPIGIDAQLSLALIFGFIAKEIVVGSLAAIYGLEGDALMGLMAQRLDWVQAYSFMLFTLIYLPCLSTVATLRTESKSRAFMFGSIFWSLLLAWLTSFVFYQGARSLGF